MCLRAAIRQALREKREEDRRLDREIKRRYQEETFRLTQAITYDQKEFWSPQRRSIWIDCELKIYLLTRAGSCLDSLSCLEPVRDSDACF